MDTGPTRPSIVLFMVDQLGARWIERALCDEIVPLPNFRRLAGLGVTFSRAYSTNPVCTPARATIATGLTTSGHGLLSCGYTLDPEIPTFMHALQGAGWRTGAFGKLHLVPQQAEIRPDYRPYGFDVTAVTEDGRVGEWLDWVRDTHPEHYRGALATVWMTMIEGLDSAGPDGSDLKKEITEVRADFDWIVPGYPDNNSEAHTLPFPEHVSQTAWTTDRAVEFIADAPADTPLFAHVSYVQPHNPFAAPIEYADRVDVERIPRPVPAEWLSERDSGYFAAEAYARPSYDTSPWLHERRLYFADLAHLDAQLGRVLDALDAAGRLDSTTLIVTSDHGELLHDHGMVGKWERHYDPCVRVPLLVAGPGLQAGAVRTELVDHTDLAPTILDLAGRDVPRAPVADLGRPLQPDEIRAMPGRSLLPLCRGERPQEWRRAVYIQSNANYWSSGPDVWSRTLCDERYRYTRFVAGGEQLFDLVDDPDEQHNLAGEPAHRALRAAMVERLLDAVVLDAYPPSPNGLHAVGSW